MKQIRYNQNQIEELISNYRQELSYKLPCQDKSVVNVTPNCRPFVTFSDRARKMCKELVEACSKEIAWFATVTREDELTFVIEDIVMFPQKVTGTTVDVDYGQYAQWMAGLDDDTVNNMRCHCHSHVNMGVFSSGTDDEMQRDTINNNVSDYFIFLIFNKREQVFCRIYDVESNIMYDNTDIDVDYTENSQVCDEATELIAEYVTDATPVVRHYGNFDNTRSLMDDVQRLTGGQSWTGYGNYGYGGYDYDD